MKKLLATIVIGLFLAGVVWAGPPVAPSPCRWTSNGIECDGNRDGTVDLLIKKSDGSVEINGSTVDSQAGTKCENLADVTAALAGSATHIVVTGTVTLTGALELTKPVYVMAGGSFVTDGHLLTFSSSYDAGRYTTFDTNSDGSEISGLYEVKAEWFGFSPDETRANNTTYFNTAQNVIAYAANSGGRGTIGAGTFSINGITIYGSYWSGAGHRETILDCDHATNAAVSYFGSEGVAGASGQPGGLSHMTITGDTTGPLLLYAAQALTTFSHLFIHSGGGVGVNIGDQQYHAYGATFEHCRIVLNTSHGVFAEAGPNSKSVNAITFRECEISSNTGDGVKYWGNEWVFDNCIFQSNTGNCINVYPTTDAVSYAMRGGGIYRSYFEGAGDAYISMTADVDTGTGSSRSIIGYSIIDNSFRAPTADTYEGDYIEFFGYWGASPSYNGIHNLSLRRNIFQSGTHVDYFIDFGSCIGGQNFWELWYEDYTLIGNDGTHYYYQVDWSNYTGLSGRDIPKVIHHHLIGSDGAPDYTPPWVGLINEDYTNHVIYISVGTSAASDWILLGSADQHLDLTADTVLTEAQIQANKYITNQGDDGEADITLPAVSYVIGVTFLVSEAQIIEVNPPSGETFDLNGTTLDADDCVDSPAVVGSKLVATRMQNAAGTWIWSLDTVRGSWVDTGASD
jgi:hypothetical protein